MSLLRNKIASSNKTTAMVFKIKKIHEDTNVQVKIDEEYKVKITLPSKIR